MTRAPPTPLHLVLGDHAAAGLRQTVSDHGLPGDVHCIPDDLSYGPLGDGVARMEFWRAHFRGFDDWNEPEIDTHAYWRRLDNRLNAHQSDLVVWRAHNASETVLLAMACWWFRHRPRTIHVVELPAGRHLGTWPLDDLPRFYSSRRNLDRAEITALSAAYQRWCDDGSMLRIWRDGRVASIAVDAFDDVVLSLCSNRWRSAASVARQAMATVSPRDVLSDLFFSSRLRALIADGRIASDTASADQRQYAVRAAQSGNRTTAHHAVRKT